MMKIKAYAIKKSGGTAEPFYYEKAIGKNDVLVSIKYCSITRGDIQIIDNDWGDTKFPVVPGHEIIGIVEDAGPEVTSLKSGDRVGIGYQLGACFNCEFCKEGNEQFCPNQKVVGVDYYGGLAEHVVVDERFAFKLPAGLGSIGAVPLMSSGITIYSAIVRAHLLKNSTTAVLGVGGLGQLAIQFLHRMGHKVVAFSHTPGKRAIIEHLGGVYADSSNLSGSAVHNRKLDFILSTLNVDFDLETYLKLLKPRGKFCFVAQPLNKLLLSAGLLYDYAQRTIYGNYTGSRKDMAEMLDFSVKHNMEVLAEVLPFSKVNEAIEMVRSGKAYTKIVLEN
jgi:D-arabinose 1-dehydrogenase-like Zn-dependent alcohol dehydrogenase